MECEMCRPGGIVYLLKAPNSTVSAIPAAPRAPMPRKTGFLGTIQALFSLTTGQNLQGSVLHKAG